MQEKNHKLTFTTNELIVIQECMLNVTLKGKDAVLFGGALGKVQSELIKFQEEVKTVTNGDKK